MAGLLMKVSVPYQKQRLPGKRYLTNLIQQPLEDIPESVIESLQLSRSNLELFTAIQKKLVTTLRHHASIQQRVENLMSIQGVGEILALT